MFALIKSEVRDHLVYFIGAAAISTLSVIIAVSIAYNANELDRRIVAMTPLIPLIFISALGIAGMGSAQMYTDKNKNISALLSTLATTRQRIFLARIITGFTAILILLLPITITCHTLIRLFTLPIPLYTGIVYNIFFVGLSMSFACYCLGLQTGWTSNKLTPTLGALVLALILLSLLVIKGFGLHIVIILLLFIVCSLVRTWSRFMSMPLV
ncbi:MAG: hypothetical protein PVG93_01895 [Phycisphaerales bacterium]|jgi:hypothetical protein